MIPAWMADRSVDFTDLGEGTHCLFTTDSQGRELGIIEFHACKDGVVTGGSVYFDNEAGRAASKGPVWKVLSREPLTLHPSVACRDCGHHGWIREGRWIPA